VDLWLLVLFLALVQPLIGYYRFRRVAAGPGPLSTSAKLRLYGMIVATQWVLVGVCAWVLGRHDVALADLGLARVPPVTAVVAAGLVAGALVGGTLASLRSLARDPAVRLPAHLQRVARILPVSLPERAGFLGVALTAGVCEEILYRGFMIFALDRALPSTWLSLAVAALFFGGAHAYQGWRGVLTTALLGGILGALYVLCGSLWPGIGLHAVVDLVNGLALGPFGRRPAVPPAEPPAPPPTAPAAEPPAEAPAPIAGF
jgi:membrane protease YdiL (CAAX protease family)